MSNANVALPLTCKSLAVMSPLIALTITLLVSLNTLPLISAIIPVGTSSELLIVVTPNTLPMFNVSASPAKLIVLAVLLNKFSEIALVSTTPGAPVNTPFKTTSPLA